MIIIIHFKSTERSYFVWIVSYDAKSPSTDTNILFYNAFNAKNLYPWILHFYNKFYIFNFYKSPSLFILIKLIIKIFYLISIFSQCPFVEMLAILICQLL